MAEKGKNSTYYWIRRNANADTIVVEHATPARKIHLGQTQHMQEGDTLDDGTSFRDLIGHCRHDLTGRWVELTSDGFIIDDPPERRKDGDGGNSPVGDNEFCLQCGTVAFQVGVPTGSCCGCCGAAL